MKKSIFLFSTITVLLSSAFAFNYITTPKKAEKIIIQSVINAPIKTSFEILNIRYSDAIIKLEKQNIRIIDSKNIKELAHAYEISPMKIITILKG